MLDQICIDYAGYVTAVEWHVSSSYPLYSAEGRAKWRMYPPPYSGSYATPWLWVDGRQRGYNYNLWRNYVAERITIPTPVQITLSGNYDPSTRNGTIQAVIQNDSSDAIDARISVVITEDSCYYQGPNGDPWHNHVCRDYIPDQTGTIITIPAGGADTIAHDFIINTSWNEARCKIVVYAQSTTMVPADSSYPAFQGAEIAILDLVGVKEEKTGTGLTADRTALTTPGKGKAEIRFTAPAGKTYRLNLYSTDGRNLRQFHGITTTDNWLTIQNLSPGIYLYRLMVAGKTFSGKLAIVQ